MLFYLKSDDPNSYNIIKSSTASPIGSGPMYFRINQLSTFACFLVTTVDDFITFTIDGSDTTIHFTNRGFYDIEELHYVINEMLPAGLHCAFNIEGTLTFSHDTQDFVIKDASHRAKLLTGMYDMKLPQSTASLATQAGLASKQIILKSFPYTCYGNNLFLRSRISSVAGFSSTSSLVYVSICYNISEIFLPGVPIISKHFGPFTKITAGDLTNFEFTLVDFQDEPVILKAPLQLVVELVREDESCTQFVLPNQF